MEMVAIGWALTFTTFHAVVGFPLSVRYRDTGDLTALRGWFFNTIMLIWWTSLLSGVTNMVVNNRVY